MNTKHDGKAYSVWNRKHSTPTPGQRTAWRKLAAAGYSNVAIGAMYERGVACVGAALADFKGDRRRSEPPLFARKYLAREIPEVPDGMQGYWEQFYTQYFKMHYLPGVGGDEGYWLAWAKQTLNEVVWRSWLQEMKAREAYAGRLTLWLAGLPEGGLAASAFAKATARCGHPTETVAKATRGGTT